MFSAGSGTNPAGKRQLPFPCPFSPNDFFCDVPGAPEARESPVVVSSGGEDHGHQKPFGRRTAHPAPYIRSELFSGGDPPSRRQPSRRRAILDVEPRGKPEPGARG